MRWGAATAFVKSPTSIYVLYLGQGGPEATGAEYRTLGMRGTFGVSFTATLIPAPGSNLNLGNAFEGPAHEVAWPTPQAFDGSGNLLLATWVVSNMGTAVPPGTTLTVYGYSFMPEPPCCGSPLIADAGFNLICQEGGEMRVNGGAACTVGVEGRTWTEVRSLYR